MCSRLLCQIEKTEHICGPTGVRKNKCQVPAVNVIPRYGFDVGITCISSVRWLPPAVNDGVIQGGCQTDADATDDRPCHH